MPNKVEQKISVRKIIKRHAGQWLGINYGFINKPPKTVLSEPFQTASAYYLKDQKTIFGTIQPYDIKLAEQQNQNAISKNPSITENFFIPQLFNIANYPLMLLFAAKFALHKYSAGKWLQNTDKNGRRFRLAVEILFAIPMLPFSLLRMALSVPIGLIAMGVDWAGKNPIKALLGAVLVAGLVVACIASGGTIAAALPFLFGHSAVVSGLASAVTWLSTTAAAFTGVSAVAVSAGLTAAGAVAGIGLSALITKSFETIAEKVKSVFTNKKTGNAPVVEQEGAASPPTSGNTDNSVRTSTTYKGLQVVISSVDGSAKNRVPVIQQAAQPAATNNNDRVKNVVKNNNQQPDPTAVVPTVPTSQTSLGFGNRS